MTIQGGQLNKLIYYFFKTIDAYSKENKIFKKEIQKYGENV